MFHVGQKVVCVDDQNWRVPGDGNNHPVRGSIYTIKAVNGDGVALVEVEPRGSWGGYPYFSHRFRPIVEKKTDAGMAILKEILERESFDERIRQPAR